ncbi:MAG: carbon-nitrogen hydrolase family protein [Planctomycetaceae bacterium]
MREHVKLAAVGVDSRPGDLEGNLAKIDTWAGRAAEAGAELALYPELSLTGFIPNHPLGDHNQWLRAALRGAHEFAQPIPGPACDQLTGIARRHGILVSAGLLEDAGNVLYNSQIIVGPEGVLGRWRKMHIPMFETPFYIGGDGPAVIDTPLGRLGVNICFDALLPESTRLLAVKGVEIVLFPFAADPPPVTPQGWRAWAEPALRCRCQENGVFGLAANYVGTVEFAGVVQSFPGGGIAIGPRGETLAEWTGFAGRPDMLVVEFSRAALRQARAEPEYLYRFRRPELYGPLAQSCPA